MLLDGMFLATEILQRIFQDNIFLDRELLYRILKDGIMPGQVFLDTIFLAKIVLEMNDMNFLDRIMAGHNFFSTELSCK